MLTADTIEEIGEEEEIVTRHIIILMPYRNSHQDGKHARITLQIDALSTFAHTR